MTDEELERLRKEGDQPEPLFDPERVCAADGCSNKIVRRAGEKSSNFKRRKCCSETCGKRVSSAKAAAQRRKHPAEVPTKPCENEACDNLLTRRRDTDERWAMRRFCSNRCRMLVDPPKRKQFAAKKQAEADRKAGPAKVRIREGERWSPVFRDVTSIEPWRPASWQKQEAS